MVKRHRVDDVPMNNVDEPGDSEAMVTSGSHSDNLSVTSSHSSRGRRRTTDGDDDEDADSEKVKDLLVYYARNSTMHGIPSIVGSKLYRGRHVFWMCIVGMMAMFLGFVIYSQMSDYYGYPTVTSVDVTYVTEEDFPAVTLCDPNILHGGLLAYAPLSNYTAYQLARLTEIEGLYHVYAGKFLDKETNPPQPGNVSTVAEIEEFMRVNEIFMTRPELNPLYCSWGNYYWTVCPAARTRITDMGVCSTVDVRLLFNLTEEANKTEGHTSRTVGNFMRGLTFYLDTSPMSSPYRIFHNQGFKVVLHDADTEPLPLSSGINVQGNAVVEIDVSKRVKEGLPPPYKAFGSASCVDMSHHKYDNPLHRYNNYSKEVCEHECFIDFAV